MSKSTSTLENTRKQTENDKTVACPLCQVVGVEFLCEVGGYRIWRCPRCALDFVSPVPDERFLRDYYNREAWFEGGERGGYQNYDQQTESVLPVFLELLTQYETTCNGRNILDVGCGYGTHLAVAAERGWRPFGVEVSTHALQIARERHGNRMFLTDQIEGLVPCEFDLILLFDVIEHATDPYSLFFKLFSRGAIGTKTQVAITTPNARFHEAVNDPAKWAYRHPPSHLYFYSAEALQRLMVTLHFQEIKVSGLYPAEVSGESKYDDEFFPTNNDLQSYTGLLCQANGSDFHEFMHERYVPGTWSKITEYEHFPRYVFARERATGAKVLDFGCGTGYGSALLAEVANHVVGVDIDSSALKWASQFHNKPNLRFEMCSDLGKSLSAESFDLITCFELIEHLSETAQREFVENARRLLAPGGKLLISTPNPAVTVNYGENPYHLHEMDEKEFKALLEAHFRHVKLLGQWIRPSVAIAAHSRVDAAANFGESTGDSPSTSDVTPSNYVAVCSQQPLHQEKALCSFDSSFDYIAATFTREAKFQELQNQCSGLQETAVILEKARAEQQAVMGQEIGRLQQEVTGLRQLVQGKDEELVVIKRSKIYRLANSIRNEPLSLVKIARIIYLVTGMLTPLWIREKAQPLVARIKTAAAEIQLKRSQTSRTNTVRIAANAATRQASQGAARAKKELAETAAAKKAAIEKLVFEPASLDYAAEDAYESADNEVQRGPGIASRISHVSLVLLTKDAGPSFPEFLRAITAQELGELSLDVTVIDCCSTDSTVRLARDHGINVIQVNPARFNPGLLRNLAVKNTSGDAVVFLGQDVVPGDTRLVQYLVKPFEDPLVAGVYGRRIPSPNEVASSSTMPSASATSNSEPKAQFLQDVDSYNSRTPAERAQTCNFDIFCCALRRTAWKQIPFRPAEFGEHLEWSKQVLEAGWKIICQPAAYVVPSRRQSLKYTFKQTYLLQKQLYKLFGLSVVPSWSQLVACTLRSTRRDLVASYKREPSFVRRTSLPAKLFAFNLVTAYAQYRSVRDAQALGNKERSTKS